MKKSLSLFVLTALILSACTETNEPAQIEPEAVDSKVNMEETDPAPESDEAPEFDLNEPISEARKQELFLTYSGDYFDVDYPEDFSLENEAPDYASFISPDDEVSFAIYSPLWSGDASYILPNTYTENEVERKEEVNQLTESEIGPATQTITWITVEAKDGSYFRSINQIKLTAEGGTETQKAFSFRYQDQDSYDYYREDYLKFKESLMQYAD